MRDADGKQWALLTQNLADAISAQMKAERELEDARLTEVQIRATIHAKGKNKEVSLVALVQRLVEEKNKLASRLENLEKKNGGQ